MPGSLWKRIEAHEGRLGRQPINVHGLFEIGEDSRSPVAAGASVAMAERPHGEEVAPFAEPRRVNCLRISSRATANVRARIRIVDVARHSRVGKALKAVGDVTGRGIVDSSLCVQVHPFVDAH